MSEVSPPQATDNPPPLVSGAAASDKKNNAEQQGAGGSRQAAVISNDAGEVKKGSEIGTKDAADEGVNVEAVAEVNEGDSHCVQVAGAVDVKMVDKQNETNIGAEDMKMIDKEDACQDKVGKIMDNQHAKAAEGELDKIVQAMIDSRNSEAPEIGEEEKEGKTEEMKNTADTEDEDFGKEDACQKDDKEGKNENSQDGKVAAGDEIKVVDAKPKATDRNAEVQVNGKEENDDKIEEKEHGPNIENENMKMVDKEDMCQKEDNLGKKEDSQDAEVVEADEIEMVKATNDAVNVINTEVHENVKQVEMEYKIEEKKNEEIEDKDMRIFDKEDGYQKEDKEGNNMDSHDVKVAEGDEIKMVEAKSDIEDIEENRKDEKADKTEGKRDNANIETEDLTVLGKEDACQKEYKVKEGFQDTKAADGDCIKNVEADTNASKADLQVNEKEETRDKVADKKNDANIDADNVKIVDKENTCQKEDKEGKNDGSQDAKTAEFEVLKTVEAKSYARNAELKETGNREEKEDQIEHKAHGISVQADDVRIVNKEVACPKEDKENKNEDCHDAKAAEGEEMTMVEAKSDAVDVEVKENGKDDENDNKTKEKENNSKEENISVKHDEDKTEPVELDRQEIDNIEQIGVKKQDGSKEEERSGVDEHEASDIVEERQEDLKEKGKGCMGKQEADDREQNVEEGREELEEEEKVGASKHEVAKHKQDGAPEKQEGEKQDGQVPARKKNEEQDVQLHSDEKDNNQGGKMDSEKGEEEVCDVVFEKNQEKTIEMEVSQEGEETEMNENATAGKQEERKDNKIDDTCEREGQKKGTKRSHADMEDAINGSDKDVKVAVKQVGDPGKNIEESKEKTHKSKKARTDRDKDDDKRKVAPKSRETKDAQNTRSPYSLDRPVRAKKTVERLVEVIEKEPAGNFIVDKGRGTPLKNIPNVASRISKKKPADLKFLHQILFGKRGKVLDLKSHILEFSGFVWHESDEKHRAKAKEKLDKCVKDTLFDLCSLLAIPVSRANSRKDDIVAKILDFIAEPRAKDDSTLSDDQGLNSRKRKLEGGSVTKNPEGTDKRSRKKLDAELTSHKRQKRYSESESDEDAEDMKSNSNEYKYDEEFDGEQEDSYDSGKVASKKFSEGKGSTTTRNAITGRVPKTAPVVTLSKCSTRVSPSRKSSKDKHIPAEDSNVYFRKNKSITPKRTTTSGKNTNERRSSGKELTSKQKSAEAGKALPSKDELRKTIVRILKNVDINMATFGDILKMLDDHYKMDLSSRKEPIKHMINDELIKLVEQDDD